MMLGACELRDSFAIIPVALKELGGKKEIKIWKLEKVHRKKYKNEIGEYLYYDCKSLFDAVTAYRGAAGKYKTIASNALAFSKRIGIDPGKTNYRFDANFRRYYFGGRTECFQPGTHRNLAVLDIHSAYPYAMSQDHASGHEFLSKAKANSLDGLTREEIQRSFITLECEARGCFPVRAGAQGLIFPHEFNEFHVTGWEYIAAKDLGLIANEKISNVLTFSKTINFSPYVKHWYEYKEKHPKKIDPMNYTIGKIMMNSLYGKLAQNPARYFDYKIVKGGTPFCHCKRDKQTGILNYDPECPIKDPENHGWILGPEWDGHEIHERPTLHRYQFLHGANWVSKNIYKNVATGASVTGFTRAHLLRAMHAVGIEHVIYCDTDSLTVTPQANIAALPQTPLLGDWELEEANAPIGHFAGKKLYAIKNSADGKYKIASKGARLNQKQIVKMIDGHSTTWREKDDQTAFDTIADITSGNIHTWNNDAPTFSLAGKANFVVRNIRTTAHNRATTKDK
jgi:DNA polymerase elongation subunit (family B)